MTELGIYAEPAKHFSETIAVWPAAYNSWHRVSFYNIGWNHNSKKPHHTKEHLASEICAMVQDLTLCAVGISEVFNLRDVHAERTVILDHLVLRLNGSAARPA